LGEKEMTSYFDLVESTCLKLIDALDKADYSRAIKLSRAILTMVTMLHDAQHMLGSHLPINVKELEKALKLYGLKC